EVHGTTDDLKKDGLCVIDAKNYQEWHDLLLKFYTAAKRFVDLNEKILNDADRYPHETAARSVVDYADALRQLFDAYTDIVMKLPGHPEGEDKDNIAQAKAFVDAAFDAFDGIVGDEPPKVRKALGDLLAMFGGLSSTQAHVLTSIVALATAKDRNEVK